MQKQYDAKDFFLQKMQKSMLYTCDSTPGSTASLGLHALQLYLMHKPCHVAARLKFAKTHFDAENDFR